MSLRRILGGTLIETMGGILLGGTTLGRASVGGFFLGGFPMGRWMSRPPWHGPSASGALRGATVLGLGLVFAAAAAAQATGPATSAGPGRITCGSATACELGVGVPAKMKYRIDTAALPAADKDRLTKQCTAKAPPCVATVQGTEMGDPMKLKAASIKFYN